MLSRRRTRLRLIAFSLWAIASMVQRNAERLDWSATPQIDLYGSIGIHQPLYVRRWMAAGNSNRFPIFFFFKGLWVVFEPPKKPVKRGHIAKKGHN